MGKESAIKGALGKVAEWAEQSTPELRRVVRSLAENFLEDPASLNTLDRKTLLDYLRGPGSKQNWADMFPGALPTRMDVPIPPPSISAPSAKEVWYRGAPPQARLSGDRPIFTTRQPEGAAWYATEWPEGGYGSITEYLANVKNPARQRDMLRMMVENPKLAEEASTNFSGDPYNWLDRLYHPDMRKLLQKQGYDSALGYDVLERGDIEALVALNRDQLQPVARRLVTSEGNSVLDKVRAPVEPLDDYSGYVQIGPRRPFSRKARGGLVQMKERSGG